MQNPFCTPKHFGLYPPCSALCEVKLWLGSLYFSWQNALQKWQMQQPALETQVSWGSWKWHCPEQFGGHTPAKIEDSVVKLQTTKTGISQIGCALRNSVAFVWKKWVQIRNITWNEVISFWTANTILWSLKTGWSDKTLEICANRMCDLQKVTAGPTILPLSSSGLHHLLVILIKGSRGSPTARAWSSWAHIALEPAITARVQILLPKTRGVSALFQALFFFFNYFSSPYAAGEKSLRRAYGCLECRC